ncbi:hypothetical protein Tco_0411587 [Tanacetum coccineum]
MVASDHLRDALSVIFGLSVTQDKVMSDSDESGVTYTEISSTFEELSDIGSPGVEDEVFLAEEQPLPATASPTAQLLDYVPESNPKADPEEDDDEDPEEDPVDGGDDGNDENESSEDDEDYDMDIEADDDDEEEKHPAPTDSVVVALPVADQAPSAEETEPFEIDESVATPPPHPVYRVTARISIPALVPTPLWSDAEVARLLAISTPPSSPLSPWSSPLPQIPSLPLPSILSSPLPVSPPLPVSSPVPVLSPSPPASPICPEDIPEVTLPPRKRLGIAHGPTYKVGESSSAAAARPAGGLRADYGFVATMDREIRRDPERDVGYGITDSWDEIVETLQGAPVSTDTELGRHMTAFETRARQDTDEIYTRGQDVLRGMADRRRQTVISELLAADYKRQRQLAEALKLVKSLQTQMPELQRQQGPAKGPAQLELPEEAGSSS